MRKAVKKPQLVIVVLLSLNILGAACGAKAVPTQASSTIPIDSEMKIKVGVDANLPPFAFTDVNTNQLAGFEIELMKAIAGKTGIKTEFIDTAYSQMIKMIAKCQLDTAISAIGISDELKQQMNFSAEYYSTKNVLVVKQGNIIITSQGTLAGMMVGMQTASPGMIEAGKFPGIQLAPYSSNNLAFQDLITGYIDAVIADKPHARLYADAKPNRLKIVGEEFGTVDYGIATCKNRTDLWGTINKGLAEIKADGTLDKLTQKWFGNGGQY
jgi:polar amino acid transport system substrate-binding protein